MLGTGAALTLARSLEDLPALDHGLQSQVSPYLAESDSDARRHPAEPRPQSSAEQQCRNASGSVCRAEPLAGSPSAALSRNSGVNCGSRVGCNKLVNGPVTCHGQFFRPKRRKLRASLHRGRGARRRRWCGLNGSVCSIDLAQVGKTRDGLQGSFAHSLLRTGKLKLGAGSRAVFHIRELLVSMGKWSSSHWEGLSEIHRTD